MRTLVQMLEYRRPHGSGSERKFINRFIRPLPGIRTDAGGNYYLQIGENPRVLWSAHTDSVHSSSGKQRIVMDDKHIIKLSSRENANCLGADNAAGVWMLLELIKTNMPGLYVFHRQEESGGVGSSFFAKNMKHLLTGIEAAIAFDRRGTRSIITHQWSGQTASTKFATTLADLLGMDHQPDSGGTFTDTASYADQISECTNISVGFYSEHSKNESLDVAYLYELRNAVVALNPADLHCERTPGDDGDTWSRYWGDETWYSGYGSSSGYSGSSLYGKYSGTQDYDKSPTALAAVSDNDDDYEPYDNYGPLTAGRDFDRLVQLCKKYPEEVADYLESGGATPDDIETHIARALGIYGS
jgi:hypothetical protein